MSYYQLSKDLKSRAVEMGLSDIGITDIDLSDYSPHFKKWISDKYYAGMEYMHKHGEKRWHPEKLIHKTCRVISFRLDYWPEEKHHAFANHADEQNIHPILSDNKKAYISRYSLGRDYHKLMRKKGQQLASWLAQQIEKLDTADEYNYRVFVDSAPVLEKPLAQKAGLGWIGKHSNLVHPKHGSWFFLGEIYTSIPLIVDLPFENNHCGSCSKCIDVCPTQAIVSPYVVDANLCISYLTIEHHGIIPENLRAKIGNRIYGCDDCQLVCPWNKFTEVTEIEDFKARHHLDNISLLECFLWTEEDFLSKTQGSAIRRIGYERWLRNIAVALGNAEFDKQILDALQKRRNATDSNVLLEHIDWAIQQQRIKSQSKTIFE